MAKSSKESEKPESNGIKAYERQQSAYQQAAMKYQYQQQQGDR